MKARRVIDSQELVRSMWGNYVEDQFDWLWWNLQLERVTLEDQDGGYNQAWYTYVCRCLDSLLMKDSAEVGRVLQAMAAYQGVEL